MTKKNKILITGLTITLTILIPMGLYHFFKKSPDQVNVSTEPYNDASANLIYNLLFCDSIELYKANFQPPVNYPYDILFSKSSSVIDLQKIIDDPSSDPRVKILAYNKQFERGSKPTKKELLAVIVEVGLDGGLDVLASFNNGTARYINQTGKILIWETTDSISNQLTMELFSNSATIVNTISAWNKRRLPAPTKGNVRITFLVSNGLYFGEGPINVLFNDAKAGPALASATQLMQYLTEKSLQTQNK